MPSKETIAKALEEIVRTQLPNVDTETRFGGLSAVVIAGDRVYKSPFEDDIDPRFPEIVKLEADIIHKLSSVNPPSLPGSNLETPRLIESHPQAPVPYNVFSLVEGTIHTIDTIRQFSPDRRHHLGEAMASTALWMATTIQPDEYQKINEHSIASVTPKMIMEVSVGNTNEIQRKGFRVLASTLQLLYDEYDDLRDKELSLHGPIVGHGDLHYNNITFNAAQRLQGIFDFGQTRVTTYGEELRYLGWIDDEVTRAAATFITRETGEALSIESIRRFMLMQAVGIAALWVVRQDYARPQSAFNFIKSTLPDEDWSELPK